MPPSDETEVYRQAIRTRADDLRFVMDELARSRSGLTRAMDQQERLLEAPFGRRTATITPYRRNLVGSGHPSFADYQFTIPQLAAVYPIPPPRSLPQLPRNPLHHWLIRVLVGRPERAYSA